MNFKSLAFSLLLALLIPFAIAQALTPKAAVERVFSEPVQESWFSDTFLSQVSAQQIDTVLGQINAQLGAFKRIEGIESPFTVLFERGSATATIVLDDSGKIDTLRITDLLPDVEADQPNTQKESDNERADEAEASSDASQNITPKAALERLLTSETFKEAWFTEAVLAQVGVTQLQEIVQGLSEQLGAFQRIEGDSSPFTVHFAEGTVTTQITLDAQGRIAGIFFQNLTQKVGSLEQALAEFEALPGEASVLVLKNGEAAAALNADTPLAVGSSFKLAVLATLQAQIAAGEHQWAEVVKLEPEWKSLPSGILQDWPAGTPLTLQTLATLMISISDNTATDALIHIVGRENIEARTERNQPFLTTKEAFKLKNPENEDLLERYLNGDDAQQRDVLAALDERPLPGPELFAGDPVVPQIEWFFTTRELCGLMAQVEDLPLMGVSPGVANPDDWQNIAYKGGSEPGVLNLTTWLEDSSGNSYCVSATVNRDDAPLDDTAVLSLYGGVLEVLQ